MRPRLSHYSVFKHLSYSFAGINHRPCFAHFLFSTFTVFFFNLGRFKFELRQLRRLISLRTLRPPRRACCAFARSWRTPTDCGRRPHAWARHPAALARHPAALDRHPAGVLCAASRHVANSSLRRARRRRQLRLRCGRSKKVRKNRHSTARQPSLEPPTRTRWPLKLKRPRQKLKRGTERAASEVE